MTNFLISTAIAASVFLSQPDLEAKNVAGTSGQLAVQERVLASGTMDLSSRYPVESVSEGFKENILIAVDYLNRNEIVLQPGEVFAFHKNIMPKFRQDKIITQESGFVAKDGYKYVAGLAGNGVCHLASLMNMVATEAGLEVTAPTNHNFAKIPGIESQYGTSISTQNSPERQNLYIKNNFEFPVEFKFSLDNNLLSLSISVAK